MESTKKASIMVDAGVIDVHEAPEGHIIITTTKLKCKHVSVFLNTGHPDADLAVCVNAQWLPGAYEAGQHRKIDEAEER